MPSPKAREILRRTYLEGYEAGRRDGQRDVLARKRQTSRRQVAAVIVERLAEGPQPAGAMLQLCSELSVAVNTLRAAKAEAGVVSVKVRGQWLWATERDAERLVPTKAPNQLRLAA